MSWVQKYEPQPWVDVFSSLGAPFPEHEGLEASNSEAFNFFEVNLIFPGLVAAHGVVVALTVFVTLCCCCTKKTRDAKRPNAMLPIAVAILMFAVAFGGAMMYTSAGHGSINVLTTQYGSLLHDVKEAARICQDLNKNSESILTALDDINSSCDQQKLALANTSVDNVTAPVRRAAWELMVWSGNFTTTIEALPFLFKRPIEDSSSVLMLFLCPLMSIGLPIVYIVLAICGTWCVGSLRFARCLDCDFLKLFAPYIALTVLVVSAVTSAELYFAINASSFCLHVDTNVVSYFERLHNGVLPGLVAKYYITGEGTNELLKKSHDVEGRLFSAAANLTGLMEAQLSPVCPAWSHNFFDTEVLKAEGAVSKALKFLEPEKVYPYYKGPVHDGLCHSIIDSLGWVICTQLVVCFISLPIFAIVAVRFLRRYEAWKESGGEDNALRIPLI